MNLFEYSIFTTPFFLRVFPLLWYDISSVLLFIVLQVPAFIFQIDASTNASSNDRPVTVGYCARNYARFSHWMSLRFFFSLLWNWNCFIMIHMIHFTHMFKSIRKMNFFSNNWKKNRAQKQVRVVFFYSLNFNCKQSHAHHTVRINDKESSEFLADFTTRLNSIQI